MNLGTLHPPVLIFGGPYGNFQATSAMKNIADRLGIAAENTICTGDIVAYCGNPEETVNLIREWGCHVVMGNCEESVGYEKDDCGCGFEEGSVCATLSSNWYEHAVGHTSQDNKLWMQSLPRTICFSIESIDFSVLHGGVEDISEFIFESGPLQIKTEIIKTLGSDCVVGGHCGIPFGQETGNGAWLNPGVIGMPANDGQNNGWYLILESRGNQIIARWHELGFDIGEAVAAMQKAGLAAEYQHTLGNGLWPSMSVLPEKERHLQGVALKPDPFVIYQKSSSTI